MKQSIWELLGIAPTDQKREIRKAYAAQVKKYHVEDAPEEFERLHQAYLQALELCAEAGFGETDAFGQEPDVGEQRREPAILEQLYRRQERLDDTECLERLQETLDEQLLADLDAGVWDVESFNREYAFSCFEKLCNKIKDGGLRIFEPEEWGNLIYQAEDAYYGDARESEEWRGEPAKIAEPHCRTLIELQAYLIRQYDISEEICLELWENFEVTGRMAGYALDSYEPVLSQMLKKYPKLKEQKAGRLIAWKRELLLLAKRWQYRGWMGQKPDCLFDLTLTGSTAEISWEEWQETEQLLAQDIFLQERYHTPMLQWLIQNWTFGIVSPALTQQLYEMYEKADASPLVSRLQEALMRQMSWYQKLPDRICSGSTYMMPEAELAALGGERNFWECFFATAFPFSTGSEEQAAGQGLPCLRAYLKKCCLPSMRWWKSFTENGRPLAIDCGQLHGASAQIQITFALHHIEYRRIGRDLEHAENVFHRIIPFKALAGLGGSPEEISTFFLLLPLAVIGEKQTDEAYQEILNRLQRLPLYEAALPYIASCLAHQTDWEDLPAKPQKVIEEVYYSESERYCFRGILTQRKFALSFMTPEGWVDIKLQNGESKELRSIEDSTKRSQRLHEIVEERQPPHPECIQVIPLAKRTQREKAEAVFEALIAKRRGNGRSGSWETRTVFPQMQEFLDCWDNCHLGTGGTIVLRFGEKEEGSVTVQSYMFASSDWTMNRLLVPIRGEKRYAYRKREARLQKRVEEPFFVCGYFALEWALPIPYGVGKSGTFYSYYDHRLHKADDFEGLIAEYIDLSALKQIEIYKGYRTVSLFTGELENYYYHWYSREDKDVHYNYPFEWMRQISEEV